MSPRAACWSLLELQNFVFRLSITGGGLVVALCRDGGCAAGCETSRRRSSGDRPGDDGHDHCQQSCCMLCRPSCPALSCDLPPKKRHRHSLPAASGVGHEMVGPSEDTNGTAAEWRPTLRGTSVWRPVGPKSTPKPLHHRILTSSGTLSQQQQQQQHLPQLSPGLARYSFASERSTPSESPSPRPASASSGFFDSSQGSLNCAVVDGIPMALMTVFSYQNPLHDNLSEEAARASSGGYLSGASTASSGSMPMISEVSTQTPPSSPFSSQGVPPVRCRSQPTVLVKNRRDRSRASWKKHRRSMLEDDRPKLDFLKMTEVGDDINFGVLGLLNLNILFGNFVISNVQTLFIIGGEYIVRRSQYCDEYVMVYIPRESKTNRTLYSYT